MKAEELRKKSIVVLQQELLELLKARFNLRMQKGSDQLKKPHFFQQLNKEIARIKTILGELFRANAEKDNKLSSIKKGAHDE